MILGWTENTISKSGKRHYSIYYRIYFLKMPSILFIFCWNFFLFLICSIRCWQKLHALNKYGGAELETKRKWVINRYMKCVSFMILFVLMLSKKPMRCKSRSKFGHHGLYLLYDILHEVENNILSSYSRDISVEDSRLLSSYLPLLRDFIPSAAEEIEADMRSYMSAQGYASTLCS